MTGVFSEGNTGGKYVGSTFIPTPGAASIKVNGQRVPLATLATQLTHADRRASPHASRNRGAAQPASQ